MKKIIFLNLALTALISTSCVKKYKCNCSFGEVVNYQNADGETVAPETRKTYFGSTEIKNVKREATRLCENGNDEFTYPNEIVGHTIKKLVTYTNCKLK